MTDMEYKGHLFDGQQMLLTNPPKTRCKRCAQAYTDASEIPPCPNCPTCTGPNRETVGMVCQTCGTDYGAPDPMAELTPAESMGVLVTQAIHQAELERNQARDIAVNLEQQLAQAMVHLTRCLAVLAEQGTTFAADSRAVVQANEFLEGLRSEETPKEGPTT